MDKKKILKYAIKTGNTLRDIINILEGLEKLTVDVVRLTIKVKWLILKER